jgi:CheY-like chemotaxis protein
VKTILCVDDAEDDVFFLKRAFQKAGLPCMLHVAKNGDEAVDYLSGKGCYAEREVHALPELVLLDVNMPSRDGHEVLNWIRSQPDLENLPVVMLSSSREPSDIQRAYRAGANSYLVKPIRFQELENLLPLVAKYWLEINATLP